MTVRVEKTFAEYMDTDVTASIASLPSAEQKRATDPPRGMVAGVLETGLVGISLVVVLATSYLPSGPEQGTLASLSDSPRRSTPNEPSARDCFLKLVRYLWDQASPHQRSPGKTVQFSSARLSSVCAPGDAQLPFSLKLQRDKLKQYQKKVCSSVRFDVCIAKFHFCRFKSFSSANIRLPSPILLRVTKTAPS